jgi:uncharacterized protein YkwD
MSSIALTSGPTPRRSARRWVSIALGLAALGTTVTFGAATTASAVAPAPDDWLGIVNVYRAQSGLAPVSENPTWSVGARNHSCWMLLNGIAHDETPGTPGYTVEGDQAGNSGNVAVSSNSSATPRSHIDLWMTGPFHAIGLLRSSLQQSAFGLCASPPNPTNTNWKSAATLDVVRGNVWGAAEAADACRLSRQRSDDQPDPLHRGNARPENLLRLGRQDCRPAVDRLDARGRVNRGTRR